MSEQFLYCTGLAAMQLTVLVPLSIDVNALTLTCTLSTGRLVQQNRRSSAAQYITQFLTDVTLFSLVIQQQCLVYAAFRKFTHVSVTRSKDVLNHGILDCLS